MATKIWQISHLIWFLELSTKILSRFGYTVKIGNKERLDKEQLGNSEPFSVTNMPVYLINSEQICNSEPFCHDQKKFLIRLY